MIMCNKPVEDAKKVLSAAKAMQDEIDEIMKPVVADEGPEAPSQGEGRTLRVDGHAVDFPQLGFEHYRKLPVVIRAVQIFNTFEVDTLEGMHTGSPGDFLIEGVHGELYPCKPDIFAETYELVDNPFEKIEQPPPISGSSPVGPVAREMFERILQEQEAKGLEKYGMRLSIRNGRNPILDAMAEVVDAFQYLSQAHMEQIADDDLRKNLIRQYTKGDDD